jgi:hypothetical protein
MTQREAPPTQKNFRLQLSGFQRLEKNFEKRFGFLELMPLPLCRQQRR